MIPLIVFSIVFGIIFIFIFWIALSIKASWQLKRLRKKYERGNYESRQFSGDGLPAVTGKTGPIGSGEPNTERVSEPEGRELLQAAVTELSGQDENRDSDSNQQQQSGTSKTKNKFRKLLKRRRTSS